MSAAFRGKMRLSPEGSEKSLGILRRKETETQPRDSPEPGGGDAPPRSQRSWPRAGACRRHSRL